MGVALSYYRSCFLIQWELLSPTGAKVHEQIMIADILLHTWSQQIFHTKKLHFTANTWHRLMLVNPIYPAHPPSPPTQITASYVMYIKLNKPSYKSQVHHAFLASLNPENVKKVCPHALKIVASLLILEVTTFLRECYQYLPMVSLTPHPLRPNMSCVSNYFHIQSLLSMSKSDAS